MFHRWQQPHMKDQHHQDQYDVVQFVGTHLPSFIMAHWHVLAVKDFFDGLLKRAGINMCVVMKRSVLLTSMKETAVDIVDSEDAYKLA
uniref:Uncharacterized protein n=1 Tax=Acrobeloides nanus TaxID=290746 RepID=A0A914EN56_9BILA